MGGRAGGGGDVCSIVQAVSVSERALLDSLSDLAATYGRCAGCQDGIARAFDLTLTLNPGWLVVMVTSGAPSALFPGAGDDHSRSRRMHCRTRPDWVRGSRT